MKMTNEDNYSIFKKFLKIFKIDQIDFLKKEGRKRREERKKNFKRYFAANVVDKSHQEFKSRTLRMCMRTLAVISPAWLRMRMAYTWRAQKINDPA